MAVAEDEGSGAEGRRAMGWEIRAQVDIEAPREAVWKVLMDFDSYPSWNPFIRRVEGRAEVGSKLTARLEPPTGRGMTFRPTVTTLRPGEAFGWLGRLGLPGVFDGAHRFDLEALDGSRTRFLQSERFDGILAGLLQRSIRDRTLAGFEEMNRALAQRARAAGSMA
jgi:hypothetical protein